MTSSGPFGPEESFEHATLDRLAGLLQEELVVLDADGAVLRGRYEACETLGINVRDDSGHLVLDPAWTAVDHEGHVLQVEDHPARLCQLTGVTVRREMGVSTSVEQLWLRVTAAPLTPGRVMELSGERFVRSPARGGVLVTYVDVTAQSAHASRLALTEQRLALTFEHSPIGIAIVGLDGRFVEVNRALCDILGRDDVTLTGMTFGELTHPDDLADDLELLENLTTGNTTHYEMHKRYLLPSGRNVWCRLVVSLVRDAAGRPLHYLSQIEDISEIRAAQELLEHRALHDVLTGLPNRELVMDRLTSALRRAEHESSLVLVAFIDLDHFKQVNDSLGHAAGDRFLRMVGERLVNGLRPSDSVGRMGGDEFVAVVEGVVDEDEAVAVIERIKFQVEKPVDLGGTTIQPSISVGLALSDRSSSAEILLRNADTALYTAKDSGRSRWELFNSAMRHRAIARLSTEAEIRRALERHEFELFYQPIVDLRTGETTSFEALARWRHPQRGLLPPSTFIDVAEDSGLIIELGTQVLRMAARFLVDHPDNELPVMVNVSPRQLGSHGLCHAVEAVIEEYGIDARRLGLEITESSLLRASGSTLRDMEALARLGAMLVVDDFGTGFSAMSSLMVPSVRGLKLDQSFTAALSTDPNSERITHAIAGLANSLGFYSVAEGVETREQLRLLQAMGWRNAQGFWFAEPTSDVEALLARRSYDVG